LIGDPHPENSGIRSIIRQTNSLYDSISAIYCLAAVLEVLDVPMVRLGAGAAGAVFSGCAMDAVPECRREARAARSVR
jgi:hypothetical protein